MSVAFRWCKRSWCFLCLACVTALTMGGCPPPAPDGNDNEPDGINVTIAPSGSGTVEQDANGNMITLTATANTGWVFDGWSGADLTDPDQNPLTVDATEVDSITANFVEDSGNPLDTDGDGVRDSNDQCPDTPPGTTVDVVGCPATGPDADDDGVPDSADLCADTAAGATVDSFGCAAEQRDSDNDGVNDALDECADTPSTVEVDEVGCPVGDPNAPDDDADGVGDDIDQCLDTPAGETVDANGCAPSQLDSDEDGVNDAIDQCPDTPPRQLVNSVGCSDGGPPPPGAMCGNGVLEAGEQCDDGNTQGGDGCSAACQNETSGFPNETCSSPATVSDGTQSYTNSGATTDGPNETTTCNFFGQSQINSDIWFCYTATCTGTAFVSLCGSSYDTKLAAYAGCGCPTAAPLACSDDDCGRGVENIHSRVELSVTAGQSYLLRVGGYPGSTEEGAGRLTIGCNTGGCTGATGDCFSASTSGEPGCGDAQCCADTCELDQFCCDVTWDQKCAGEAEGICTGNFSACTPTSGSCSLPDATPGCEDSACCNAVCQDDPYCCLTQWDATCVNEAESICFLTCGPNSGDCGTTHTSPGCNVDACCRLVCGDDPFCCDTAWDEQCVAAAASLCP